MHQTASETVTSVESIHCWILSLLKCAPCRPHLLYGLTFTGVRDVEIEVHARCAARVPEVVKVDENFALVVSVAGRLHDLQRLRVAARQVAVTEDELLRADVPSLAASQVRVGDVDDLAGRAAGPKGVFLTLQIIGNVWVEEKHFG